MFDQFEREAAAEDYYHVRKRLSCALFILGGAFAIGACISHLI